MDARTLEALKASIAKWERNALVKSPDDFLTSDIDCPLCHLFFHNRCNGCPVMERTGMDCCDNSPYRDAVDAAIKWRCGGAKEPAHAAAREEVAFLKSLLPEGAA